MNYSESAGQDSSSELRAKIKAFRENCRQAGLKVTPQRMAIYKALIQSKEHPSAEMLYREVRQEMPNISLDTVNRTLITFSETGMAYTVEGTGDPRRFDGNLTDHQHFRCLKCRRVVDIINKPFADISIPMELRKFIILRKTLYFEGICDICRQKSE